MNQPHTIFFVGKPGSGKGTQAKMLSEATGWKVVGTSAGLREIVAHDGPIGSKLKETMDAGILTPYWLAAYVYFEAFFKVSKQESVIFDGTSRTLREVEIVLDSLTWINRPFSIFHLKVSDEVVRSRIALRKEKEGRTDDHALDKRLEEYYAHTEKAINFYHEKDALIELNGEEEPEVIAAQIRTIINLPTPQN